MIKPEISEQIGGYLLEWGDTKLSVKIGRLNVHSDGRVTGEIQITNSSLDKPLILLPSTQFNFSSEQTRSKFAKQLKEKFPDAEHNWVEIFDYLGYKVQDLARTGEPVLEIWAEDGIESPEFLLKPFIYKGVSNIIYGEKGVNKSTLAYAFGACLALPWDDNPLALEVPGRPVKSLVLDWETDEYIFRYYLSRMKRGMLNDSSFPLFYRKCRLPLAEELESIEKHIQETSAEVLIIDSLAAAAGGEQGELKGSQSALQFNTALRKLGKTALIIAQTSKSQESSRKTIYGSVIFTYYARNIFELCRNEEDDSDTSHLAIFHRECNLGKRHPPMGFALTFNDQERSLRIEREPVSAQEFATKVSLLYKIHDLLKRGSLTAKEIADGIGEDVNKVIPLLRKSRQIQRSGDKWQLKSFYCDSDSGASSCSENL